MRSQVARKKAQHFKVFQAIEDDSHLLDLLVIATSPAQKAFFITALIKSLPLASSGYSKEPEDLFSIFTTWFGQYKPQSNTSFPHITTALQLRQQYFIDNWFQKWHFIHAIGLDWTPAMNDAFYSTGQVQTIYLSKLPTAYPPIYHWMVESSAINNQWRTYIEEGKQPNWRHPRYPLFYVDPSRL